MIKNNSRITFSIIVPVYNEEEGIEDTIIEILKDLKIKKIKRIIENVEIIIINDGSTDNTDKILQRVRKRFNNIKVIKHKTNLGLGASIKTGIKNSSQKYITYLPADGQVFLREISRGLEIAPKADLVLTFRGRKEDYNQYRYILSNTLMIFMKIFFGLNFKDYNWVHIYKRSLFNSIKTKSKGVFYLAEIVVRTYRAGFKILEVPANYHPRTTGYSKNAKPSIAIETLIDLFKLWIELNTNLRLK